MSETSTNPKDKIGLKKSPLRLVPPALVIGTAPAMANGAAKYGAYNWRDTTVSMTVYLEAILRHTLALLDGENYAADSGCHHMSHIAANAAIFFDADALGRVIDDRPKAGPASKLMEAQVERSNGSRSGVAAAKGSLRDVGDPIGNTESVEFQRLFSETFGGSLPAATARDGCSEVNPKPEYASGR